jgi:hypothetical protein
MNFTYLFLDKTNIEMVPKDCKTNILEATKSQVVVGYENSLSLKQSSSKRLYVRKLSLLIAASLLPIQ